MDHTIIKDAATKIVANIKTMEDDITVLRNKQDIISTSDTTMTGSYPGRLSIEEIGGQCEQFTTTGKNCISIRTFDSDIREIKGITYTIVRDSNGSLKYINVNGIATETSTLAISLQEDIHLSVGERYILSGCPSGGGSTSYRMHFYNTDGNKTFVRDYGDGVEFVFTNETTDYNIAINIDSGVTVSNLKFYPMIRLASITDPTYEPYTGGQPSPNPDYPQEIKKTVISEIKTHGKNMFDCRGLQEQTTNGVNFTPKYDLNGDLLYVEVNGTASMNSEYNLGNFTYMADESYILSGCPSGGSDYTYKIKALSNGSINDHGFGVHISFPSDTKYTAFIVVYSGQTVSGLKFYPMIRKADMENATYEPYTESTITLSQPIELYGIGDVQDTIEDGKVKRKIGKAVFDGSSDEYWYSENNYFRMQGVNTDNTVPILCKHLRQTKIYEEINSVSGTMWVIVNGFSINMTGVCSTVSELRTWLADNQLTIFYGLPTEAIEPLPTVDQIALNSLKTYDGITYVEIDSEIKPTFKAEYGVTKIGGYTLKGVLAGANGVSLGQSNTDRITALEATLVNNI